MLTNVKGNSAVLSLGTGSKNDNKRVRMFRGKKLIQYLKEERVYKKFAKILSTLLDTKLEQPLTDEQAYTVSQKLLDYCDCKTSTRLFAACDKLRDTKKESVKVGNDYAVRPLDPNSPLFKNFDSENGRYYYTYMGNAAKLRLVMILVITLVLLLCLYPLWPAKARVVVWYLSVTVLLTLIGVTAIQLVVFLLGWMVGYSVWIVPNLWADVPIQEIFKPMFTMSKSSPGQAMYRMAVIGGIIAMGYWISLQETSFDEFLDQQKKVVEDLYAGNLLSDTASAGTASAGKGSSRMRDKSFGYGKSRRGPNIPSLEELDSMFEEAGMANANANTNTEADAQQQSADVINKVFEDAHNNEQDVPIVSPPTETFTDNE